MVKYKKSLNKYWTIVKNALLGFGSDNASKLSGSLAYSTIFSLPPMLLLIIVIGGSVYGADAFSGRIFSQLKDILGDSTALQIQNVIKGLHTQEGSFFAAVIGTIALIVGATGVFAEIQSSLNFIWGVQAKPKKGIIKLLINRLLSISMILGLGFLLIVSLIINTLLVALSQQILGHFPELPLNMINIISFVVIFFVLSFLFSAIFKIMPDVQIKWRQVWPGAFVTTFLFLIGKLLINIYISTNNTITLYGAAGSVIILLVWIYFSALIFYFGAEFTKSYIEFHGKRIEPTLFAEYDYKQRWHQYISAKEKAEEDEKAKMKAEQEEQQTEIKKSEEE